jgi:hypothetical protein
LRILDHDPFCKTSYGYSCSDFDSNNPTHKYRGCNIDASVINRILDDHATVTYKDGKIIGAVIDGQKYGLPCINF